MGVNLPINKQRLGAPQVCATEPRVQTIVNQMCAKQRARRRNPRQSVTPWLKRFWTALSGNQTRAACVAGEHSTTEPTMLLYKSSFVRSQTPDQNTAYQRDGWWRPTHMGSKIGRDRTVVTEEQCWIQGWMNSYGSIGRSLLFILFGPNLMFEPRVEHWRRFPVPDTPHSLRSLIVFHNFLHISGRPYLWQSFYSKAFKSIRRT